ncbi:MAG: hypothetical protein ABIK89_07035, partial [Planctomycetota bacterium]
RKRTSASPQGSTGASSLFIDAPKPLDFFELRPSGNREEAPVLLVCAFHVRKSRMNRFSGLRLEGTQQARYTYDDIENKSQFRPWAIALCYAGT